MRVRVRKGEKETGSSEWERDRERGRKGKERKSICMQNDFSRVAVMRAKVDWGIPALHLGLEKKYILFNTNNV